MSFSLDHDVSSLFDAHSFQNDLAEHYRFTVKRFRKISFAFIQFNLLFALGFGVELTLFFCFLSFFSQSAVLAFSLGGLFLTGFSYFVLLFYFQAKKGEQLIALKEQFLRSCKKILPMPQTVPQHRLSTADALLKLVSYLQDCEWNFCQNRTVRQIFSRFFARCYWGDHCQFRQLLLGAAVQEQVQQIRVTPTDLEVHASLANTYVAFSRLYRDPRAQKSRKLQGLFHEKSKNFSRLAIEEFKILSQYAPNDPWVHEQLAAGFCELGLHEEQIKEMELLLKLRPHDQETLFCLGRLYFQQGCNAKGLQIYEELQQANDKKAQDLIASYGPFSSVRE